ncbi:apolipoprotein N-acyltransferase [Corynebacterium renale]|uniref:Apolipoprotein N-acyltransferase n=1 Tax=Corynebacterium renale TaxID=1724 RepID=A0A2A9DPQ2_9CORY|nr:apolipoprotein N-acyltransferase [Corynebacterium renale]PFG28737.1 apolipoprotein N-acyltransferase [Corynebacterium renale]SQI26016.1 apolipoprotein N-acyltransferase [Corynebacterium renale]
MYASYEPLGWWWAALIGLSLLTAGLIPWTAKTGPSGSQGAFLGWVFGLVTYLLLLPWIGEFVGQLPYVALALACSLYSLLMGCIGALLLRHHWGIIIFPFWFVATEFFVSSWPFGGFAWVRVAWGQIEGPLAGFARWGGPALVTFWATAIAVWLVAAILCRPTSRRGFAVATAVFAVIAVIQPLLIIATAADPVGSTKVAAVQGNVPRMGLDFNAQRRAVLANHVRETQKIDTPVDIVVWPENSSDVNPYQDKEAADLIRQASAAVNAPILVGTITVDDVGPRNTMTVINPDYAASSIGPFSQMEEFHHKKYLQPFGETMPMREFFRLFSSYVDQAGNFQPGEGDGVVRIGGIALGIATCFEVIFDQAYREAVRNGAQLLATPTNNATFGFTDMTYQQLAMSRMRAIELDRAVVVAATSGVSAIVEPDGSVLESTEIFEANNLVAELPLKDSVTPAARFGYWVQLVLVMIGVFGAAIVIGLWWRSKNKGQRARRRRI